MVVVIMKCQLEDTYISKLKKLLMCEFIPNLHALILQRASRLLGSTMYALLKDCNLFLPKSRR